jgi:hypothetical protein
MKVRRLQRLNDKQQWVDCAYAYEKPDGQPYFRFNSVLWGHAGDRYNALLGKSDTKLEDIETVIKPGQTLRWLPIEQIAGTDDEIKAVLDESCNFPKVRSVAKSVTV